MPPPERHRALCPASSAAASRRARASSSDSLPSSGERPPCRARYSASSTAANEAGSESVMVWGPTSSTKPPSTNQVSEASCEVPANGGRSRLPAVGNSTWPSVSPPLPPAQARQGGLAAILAALGVLAAVSPLGAAMDPATRVGGLL